MKLEKFYDLVSRSAEITLVDAKTNNRLLKNFLKNIPDEYDNCTVVDFSVLKDGSMIFQIEK
jgi:polyhydroxyalkanoate synthesis regulator protein|nr:MAG TPA: hypothetical protein [Caudoviricetes sp.]